MQKRTYHLIISTLVLFLGCNSKDEEVSPLRLEDVLKTPSLSISSVAQSYVSDVNAYALKDMDDTVLCISASLNQELTTYFIQPDKTQVESDQFKFKKASIIDMKTALLIKDNETGKTVLIFLPGRFPIDSLALNPDLKIPAMGISRYQSTIEKISSRWTEVICRCVETNLVDTTSTPHKPGHCDTGGISSTGCSYRVKDQFIHVQQIVRKMQWLIVGLMINPS